MGEKLYFLNVILWCLLEQHIKLALATTIFHKNENQTTGVIPAIGHTSFIEHRLIIYFFKEIIPLKKLFVEISKCQFLSNIILT